MRMWILLWSFGLAVWAQSPEGEPRTNLHYDGARRVLVLSVDTEIAGERLEIMDLIGRRVRIISLPALPGSEVVSVPVADLPEGLYYVRWITENGRVRAVRRFAISR